MAEYEMCEPFGIDDGELNGLTVQQAFTAGFQAGGLWGACSMLSDPSQEAVRMIVYSDNEERCTRFGKLRGCVLSKRLWVNDDWVELEFTPPTSTKER